MGRIGATVIVDRFDALVAPGHIERDRITHSHWVPTMFVRMLRLSDAERDRHDPLVHRFATDGAGPRSIAAKEAILAGAMLVAT